MTVVEFIFGSIGCAGVIVPGCIATRRRRRRRHIDQATRKAFAQVGANAAWARGERLPEDPGKAADEE